MVDLWVNNLVILAKSFSPAVMVGNSLFEGKKDTPDLEPTNLKVKEPSLRETISPVVKGRNGVGKPCMDPWSAMYERTPFDFDRLSWCLPRPCRLFAETVVNSQGLVWSALGGHMNACEVQ